MPGSKQLHLVELDRKFPSPLIYTDKISCMDLSSCDQCHLDIELHYVMRVGGRDRTGGRRKQQQRPL